MRVALHVGQLRQRIPGGIGTYVRELREALPPAGVDLTTFATGRAALEDPAGHELGWPGPPLRYALWHGLRRPRVRVGAEVVHAPSLAVPPTGRTPLVVTVHDVAFLRMRSAFGRRGAHFHRRGLAIARKRAAAIVAPSAFTCEELVEEGFDPARLFVAPHGAPTVGAELGADARAAVLERLGVPTPYVLAVGTVEPRKGLETLFAAFAELRLRGVTLVVAGPPGWGEVRIPDGVVALGAVTPAALDVLYRGASACAVASRYEGFGLPALEAMARGTPVVASDATSLPEVVGDAGVLVAPDDVDGWAEALAAVVGDAQRRDALARAGLRRASEHTWERSAQRHLDAYRGALAAR